MTTETVEPSTEVVAAEETKTVPAVDTLPEGLAQLVVMKAETLMPKIKAVTAKINAAGNIGELLSEAIKSSDDPKVKENLQKMEKANQALINWQNEIEAIVKPTLSVPSDEEIKAAEEEYKSLVSNVKTLDTVFTGEVGSLYPELSIYDYVGELPKGKRSSTGAKAGQGEGSSRPRVSEVAVSTDNGTTYSKVEKDGKSTFSTLVAWIKKETGESISASDLHEAWFEQNGNVKAWTDLPEQTTFNYSLGTGEKAKSFFVRVTK